MGKYGISGDWGGKQQSKTTLVYCRLQENLSKSALSQSATGAFPKLVT